MKLNGYDEKRLVVGLDIGTRSVVGVVAYNDFDEENHFKVLAAHVEFHSTRSMIDGQIQDVDAVARTIFKVKQVLETKIGTKIKSVYVAAAGRVLKTVATKVELENEEADYITEDKVNSLELLGIEKATKKLISQNGSQTAYYCVGYTVVKYFLNDYEIASLKDQKGKKVGLEILATFLPNEVVDSLYAVIEKADMTIKHLTLEPIAASNVAIPVSYRLLNIALVDIGAGTSDIAITSEGAIKAYGMIPIAGDEITEAVLHSYFVDFATAEKMKLKASVDQEIDYCNVMAEEQTTNQADLLDKIMPVLKELAKKISDKIKELNQGQSTNAVFVVGGGGQVPGFVKLLAEELGLPENRVSLRGKESLAELEVNDPVFKKMPEFITPIGICYEALQNDRQDFVEVYLNDQAVRVFNKSRLTVMDVMAAKGIEPKLFVPTRGNGLSFYCNEEKVVINGEMGEPAKIYKNKRQVSLDEPIEMHDYLTLESAQDGRQARMTVYKFLAVNLGLNEKRIKEYKETIKINQQPIQHLFQSFKENDQLTFDTDKINKKLFEETTVKSHSVSRDERLKKKIAEEAAEAKRQSIELAINVNQKPLQLKGKKDYMFADIFNYLDFDIRQPKGQLICTVNGQTASYVQELKAGDQIQIYWKNKQK